MPHSNETLDGKQMPIASFSWWVGSRAERVAGAKLMAKIFLSNSLAVQIHHKEAYAKGVATGLVVGALGVLLVVTMGAIVYRIATLLSG
jgi:hypothetical protein